MINSSSQRKTGLNRKSDRENEQRIKRTIYGILCVTEGMPLHGGIGFRRDTAIKKARDASRGRARATISTYNSDSMVPQPGSATEQPLIGAGPRDRGRHDGLDGVVEIAIGGQVPTRVETVKFHAQEGLRVTVAMSEKVNSITEGRNCSQGSASATKQGDANLL